MKKVKGIISGLIKISAIGFAIMQSTFAISAEPVPVTQHRVGDYYQGRDKLGRMASGRVIVTVHTGAVVYNKGTNTYSFIPYK